MDRKFIEFFNDELTHVRRMADEFKVAYPEVAARLQLGQDPPDPYIQQLMDGFAFLAARVQLKLDAEYPRFIEALLETVYPHYLAPIPSMAIVSFQPQFDKKDCVKCPIILRDTVLTTKWQPELKQAADSVRCKYVIRQSLQVLPIKLKEARYLGRDLSEIDKGWGASVGARAAVCLRLESQGGVDFSEIEGDRLSLYLQPHEDLTGILYEQLLAHTRAVVVQVTHQSKTFHLQQPPRVRGMGFADDEAMLPEGPKGFSGYRVLQEYFAFPNRFFFIEVSQLRKAFLECPSKEIELVFCLDEENHRLEERLNRDCFELHCAPAINLFPMDNIIVNLDERREEHTVVADNQKPLEYEVHSITKVVGRPKGANRPDSRFQFFPFYFSSEADAGSAGYFTARREARRLTDREIREDRPVADYMGSEVFLSLAGPELQATLEQLNSLHIQALCTNRHLPTRYSSLVFDPSVGVPLISVKTIAKTAPQPPQIRGQLAWRVVSHLALNYRALLASNDTAGAVALQDLLKLYAPDDRAVGTAQIRALKKAVAKPIFRRIESKGPVAYARGLGINLEVDETPFKDTGVFLLGAVLNQFFSRFVSLNSFVETELETVGDAERKRKVFKWPISKGSKEIL